jgi:hypothetical protein
LEFFDFQTAPARCEIVPQFVDENHEIEAQDDDEDEKDIFQGVHALMASG